ncbi:S9 family peptidase [Perlabentimonas gracilis]|uniref:S9 family peptidase n=1 Tax=Perlabentimonas gracilis TaxID=2715279 RepID=UPI00140BE0EE|nr:DPP IV N-terminal domain-containing protein [Perlabentimonas gracilis]NHB67143.1 prolyl oligopeptidase family serine peptidase [Perlabentimonas gracilis]
MRRFLLSAFLISFATLFSFSQNEPVTKANYELASRFSPNRIRKMVYSTSVDAHWLKNSTRFWYTYETSEGRNYYIVDPARKSKSLMFDNVKMAADISRLTLDPFDAQNIPIRNLKFLDNEDVIQFEIKSTLVDEDKEDDEEDDMTEKQGQRNKGKNGKPDKKTWYFEYNIKTGKLTMLDDYKKPKDRPDWANISPDGEKVVFARNHNLFWMDKESYEKAIKNEKDSTIVEHQLTWDGEEDYSYGSSWRGEDNVEKEKNKDKRKGAWALWSPDSKMIALTRSDMRKVKDLWVIKSLSNPRPTLESYKYHMPGEKNAPVEEMLVFNFIDSLPVQVKTDAFPDQTLSIQAAPRLRKERDDDYVARKWLADSNKHFYFTRTSRDLKRIDICQVDPTTGEVKTIIEERLNTYVETRPLGVVNSGRELIHWSERDGWAHFYLYDGQGNLKNQITSGPYHTDRIVNIDEKNRVLYFTANGVQPNEDPYYEHFYSINFDGSGLKLLNPGNYNHSVSMDDDNKFFVNNYSRVNTIPKSELRDSKGTKIMDLEEADFSQLFAAGYQFPEPFKVKADDGKTDIYGVMYKPFDFDSTKLYPLIQYVYPGPQTEAVDKSFSARMDRTDRLAQMGFIVITVGNRGGHPNRSKWYHNYGYGNLRNYGLADKKAAAEQLANRHKFIDINKVGIHGHSGGGFMSTAAMLVYPDFFKVAVSNAGNHENNIYNRWWSEKHHGVKEVTDTTGKTTFEYNIDKNSELAKNLKGKLLLTTGEIDNNVHPGLTIRMANALIRANKRFDFFMYPGQRHGYGDMMEYHFWLTADYFAKHLLGDYSTNVDMLEINRDIELKR